MTHAYNARLHRFAVFTAGWTLFLLAAGGLVTSNDAGLAVPDWPLSYGSVMPPMVGGVFYEHGHRVVATIAGMLTIVLAVWLARAEPRRWMRRLGWTALTLVIVQGLLGGLTVKMKLPPAVSVAHATLAQLFFCVTVALALFTSRWWLEAAFHGAAAGKGSAERRFGLLTVAAIVVQLVLGAAFRHKVIGIVPHIAWAAVVTFLTAWTAISVRWGFEAVPTLRRAAAALGSLLGVQLMLGVGAYLSRTAAEEAGRPLGAMVVFTVAHLAVGAATLGSAVVLELGLFRLTLDPVTAGVELARAQAAAIPVLKESAL
jgi:cytochrome c oxidase assembly protein subunit 15